MIDEAILLAAGCTRRGRHTGRAYARWEGPVASAQMSPEFSIVEREAE